MNKQLKQAVGLLGSNSEYYRNYPQSENNPTGKAFDKHNLLAPKQLNIKSVGTERGATLNFMSDSAPEGYTWLNLDCDKTENNNPKEELAQAKQIYGLPDTYTVSTASENATHNFFLVPDSYAEKIKKIKVGMLPLGNSSSSIEVKIALKNTRHFVPMPGNSKYTEHGELIGTYDIANNIEPQLASPKLLAYLDKYVVNIELMIHDRLRKNQMGTSSDEDSQTNQKSFMEYYSTEIIRLMSAPKQEGGRNDYLYGVCIEAYTRKLSFELGLDLVDRYFNTAVILDTPLDFEELRITAKSAYDGVHDAGRTMERSRDEIFEAYDLDEFKQPVVSFDQYAERVEYISKCRLASSLPEPEFRRAYCETLIQDGSTILVPKKKSEKQFLEAFERESNNDKVNWTKLSNSFKERHLYFERIVGPEFERQVRFTPIGGSNTKSLLKCAEHQYIFCPNVIRTEPVTETPEFVFKDNTAYIGEQVPFLLESFEITKKEQNKLEEVLSVFRHTLTDENNNEEFEFLLDRLAIQIQNPGEMVDNIPVFIGEGGIGKSYFLKLIASMHNRKHVTFHAVIETAFDKHSPITRINIVEEFNEKDFMKNGYFDKLKGLTSAESVEINEKFVQQRTEDISPQFMFSTNHEITNMEISTDRRTTLFNSPNDFLKSEFDKKVKGITEFFLGTVEQPLHGLRIFYTMLSRRNITRTDWKFHTKYQEEAICRNMISDKQTVSMINMVANLGFTHLPEHRMAMIDTDDMSNEEFITNTQDTYWLITNHYTFTGMPPSLKLVRNKKLKSWVKGNSLTSHWYNDLNYDPEKMIKSEFGLSTTWQRGHGTIESVLKFMTNSQIEFFGLEDHKKFLSTNPTKEKAIEFLTKKYPEQEVGSINHMEDIDFDEEEY